MSYALLHVQGRDGGGCPHDLISAFVRDVAGRGEGDGSGMDVVTLIDCDFGRGDSWPNFASVEVMDPVLMFVGDVAGARRHAVGVGMTPLGQPQ